jgi:hypothetical protein
MLMKTLRLTLFHFFVFTAILVFQNCDKKNDESPKDVTINILESKTEWVVSSVNVPTNSATEDSDWDNFKVSFTDTNMTTAEYPTGARAVWPSGTYVVSEDGKSITRQDGVVMNLNPITETAFTAIFIIPLGVNLGTRIAALDGEYTFNMK